MIIESTAIAFYVFIVGLIFLALSAITLIFTRNERIRKIVNIGEKIYGYLFLAGLLLIIIIFLLSLAVPNGGIPEFFSFLFYIIYMIGIGAINRILRKIGAEKK